MPSAVTETMDHLQPVDLLHSFTASEHACDTVLWPILKDWLPQYPEIEVELSIDQRMNDIIDPMPASESAKQWPRT